MAVLLWFLASVLFAHGLIPGPLQTLVAALKLINGAEIITLLTTLWRTFAAFALSLVLAIGFALLGQLSPLAKAVIKDLMSFVIRIPSIAAISFFVLLSGAGQLTIYFSVMTVVIPVTCLSILGIYEKINPGMQTINRVYRIPLHRQAIYLYLPTLFAGFHATFVLSYSLTFKALIMAEFLGGLSGMGYGLMLRRETLDLTQLTAYVLIIALVGMGSQSLLERLPVWWNKAYARS